MSNPNNCAKCDHKRTPQGGWCYMFRDEPTGFCAKHTALPRIRLIPPKRKPHPSQ
jgi:hypothetical protein